ncbi:MAG TPA: DUF3014 domain-containing protein [Woeseiaceae bacterium]|nr:DUF3014 domain-containing protein [Woeseiaceae bacterium]
MRRESLQWIVPVVLAVGVAAAIWFYWSQGRSPERPAEQPAAETSEPPAAAETGEPDHPLPEPEPEPAATGQPALRPLPPLDESDEYFEMALTDLFGNALEERLVDTRLIERLVATVDNLPRNELAERIKPLETVPGQFDVERQNESTEQNPRYTIDPDNYERYDALVAMVANTGTEEMAELYRRFYPLLQKAYVDLGYPDAYFNDRVVEVIDHLLATPEVEGPVELVRPHVLYEYADPELEQLSSGQKALIRIGSENASVVKQKLREFRELITQDR